MKHIVLICTLIFLNSCTGLQLGAGSEKARMAKQLSPFVSDEQILDYLSTEAEMAGVSWIKTGVCKSRSSYGCSSWDTKSRRGVITLNDNISGGTGVTNIAHEIAHIAAFRKSCFAHGDLWLEYLMGMAQRYETRFPGERWGSSTPTDSVQAKYQRYASERSMCSTTLADVHNTEIQCIQEELNELDYDAGPENGLNSPKLQSALATFEEALETKNPNLLTLTGQTAPGLCDVVRNQYLLFGVTVDGEPDVDLEFRLYSTDEVTAATVPNATTSIFSGQPQTIFVGERQLETVSLFCVVTPEGYGFNNAAGDTSIATCEQFEKAKITSAKSRLVYWATLVKR